MPWLRTPALGEDARCEPREGGKGCILRATEGFKTGERHFQRLQEEVTAGCDGVGQRF